ncbi:glycosyltransferase involved in cell wall biosynthesis [Arthrobacter sp. CAN_A214]|uniref:glycosyltransferase family 4 protein n=1 Tax=Arthrobacter sp. CAN_A214 TaxID=2787720 RepID=UPI001A35E92C
MVGLNYSPEKTGNAPYTAGLAQALSGAGRSLTVTTGYPHYPEWKRYEGYDGWSKTEVISGVAVRRLRHFVPGKPRGLARLWMELSFGLRVAVSRWGSPGIIILVSPALFSSGIALLRARLMREPAPVVLWVQDFYSLGMTETSASGSLGVHIMRAMESRILRSADGVVVIHDRFKAHAVSQLGLAPSKVKVIRNWTHLQPFELTDRTQSRSSFGWGQNDIVVLHAGNMGAKQGLDNVVYAARVAEANDSRVRFVLLGDGNQRAKLERLADGAQHVTFLRSLPGARFQEALASADILLVNELPGVKEMSVPSKLTSYFSSGVPVLAATDEGSVTAEEITSAEAGLRVDAGNPAALVAAAEELAANLEAAQQFADNGRRFVETTLSMDHAVDQYHQYLTYLAARH